MKRTTAILMSCLLIVSAFASCGKDSDSSDTASNSTVQSSEAATSEDTSEDEETTSEETSKSEETTESTTTGGKTIKAPEEAVTTTKTTTKAKTTEDTKTTTKKATATTEPTTIDTSSFKGGNPVGTWALEEQDFSTTLTFKESGKGDLSMDISPFINFKDGKVLIFDEEDDTMSYSVTGNKLTIKSGDDEMIVLEKLTGATGSIVGEYKVVDGEALGLLSESLSDNSSSVTIKIDGEKTFIVVADAFSYSVSGNMLSFESIDDDIMESQSVAFSIEGDTLTFQPVEDDEPVVLKRVK